MSDLAPAPDLRHLMEHPERFPLHRVDGVLAMEEVGLDRLALEVGTPLYAYSAAHITSRYLALKRALGARPNLVCYAAKANSNQSILRLLGGLGAGADIVSGGELERVLLAGIRPDRVVFSGVGKQRGEIDAAIAAGVRSVNVESIDELERLSTRAQTLGKRVAVSLRINPDVDPETHPYLATGLRTTKFGIAFEDGLAIAKRAHALPSIELVGLACHIGSQIVDVEPFLASLARMRVLIEDLRREGISLRQLDLGGGLGIAYAPEDRSLDVEAWGAALAGATADLDLELVLEPGRFLVANAGVLLTTVLGCKQNGDTRFVIVDAGMNDLVRPALYGGYHGIVPIRLAAGTAVETVDVVGPVCESGDFLARGRRLPETRAGDILAVLSAGAYGMVMASTYNTRALPAEVLVEGARHAVIRPRQTIADLIASDAIAPWLRATR